MLAGAAERYLARMFAYTTALQSQDELTYKGVVFNEMKGVYSSPESVYYKAVQEALFPDNCYR
jgi:Zn-dependent M16 (insulinase) family peptidase